MAEGAEPSKSSSLLCKNADISSSSTAQETNDSSEDNFELAPEFRLSKVSRSPSLFDQRTSENASIIFETLGLNDYYKNKFQLKDAQCIRRDIVELSIQGYCSDIKKLPYLILHKIMSNDIRCRTNLLKKVTKKTKCDHEEDNSENSSESDSDSDDDNDDNFEVVPDELHPVDCLLALLLCCDDFLRRDIFTRLAKCQIAIPLIIPDPLSKQLILPLWAIRSVIKEGEKLKGEARNSYHIMTYPMPIISILRFGRHQKSLTKSQILNLLIDGVDNTNNSHFFHKDCSGGNHKQLLGIGLIDMNWYLPLNKEIFEHPVTFLNLHGDAGKLPEQVKFLTEISSICLVMICNKEYAYSEKHKEFLCSSKVVLLNATKRKNKKIAGKLSNPDIIKLPKTADKVYESIWEHIKSKLNNVKTFICMEDVTKNIHEDHIFIDECCPIQQEGFKKASHIMKHIIENINNGRDGIFPLQGEPWKSWADWNKEVNRQKNRGTMKSDKYSHKITMKQNAIRKKQLCLARSLSPVMESFIDSLINMVDNYTLRTFFVQNLLLELKKFSTKNYEEKVRLYRNAQFKSAQNDLLDNGSVIAEETIIQAAIGLEHFLREMGQIYEASICCEESTSFHRQLPQLVAQLFIDGYPLELMDGDAGHVPLQWIKAVLQQTIKMLGQDHKIFVLSVLGLQSSGKSTMLNTVFGLQFNVSAGKCTHGAFMQLLPLDDELKRITKCNYVLIVDTEGLKAVDLKPSKVEVNKQNILREHDNELATFVIGLANMTIINIYGEVPGEMDDILQTTVHAFLRMTAVNIDCSCHFVHQNATSNDKTELTRPQFTEKLNKFTRDAAKEENCEGKYKYFNDIIRYDDKTSSHYFPGLWKGNPPMATVDKGYSETAQLLKLHIVKSICMLSENESNQVGLKISGFCDIIFSLWEALLKENFVFSFRNTHEISSYNLLEIEYTKCSRKFKQAMIEWEATTDNEISCGDSSNLSNLLDKKRKDLLVVVSQHFSVAEAEMNTYFESNQGIITKWKASFELKLRDEKTIISTRASLRLDQLIKAKKDISDFEDKKNNIVKKFKKSVQKSIDAIKEEQKMLKISLEQKRLSSDQIEKLLQRELFLDDNLKAYKEKGIRTDALTKIRDIIQDRQNKIARSDLEHILFQILTPEEVNIILKQSSHSKNAPKKEFEKIWEGLMSNVTELSPTKLDHIACMVEVAVRKHVGPQGGENQLSEVLNRKPLIDYTEFDLTLIITDNHFSIPGLYKQMVRKLKNAIHYNDTDYKKVDEITKSIFESAQQHIKAITGRKNDFTATLISELLYYIDDKIGAPKKEFDIQFTHQYRHEMYVRICGYAITLFFKMSEAFANNNDPRKSLQAEKNPLFIKYLNQYRQIETEESVASMLCAYLEVPIIMQVKKRLGAIINKKIETVFSYMGNKQKFRVQVLTDLLMKDDYSSFMTYVLDVKKCLIEHIRKYFRNFCDQKSVNSNKSELQKAALDEVNKIIDVIRVILSKPMRDNITLKEWLIVICSDQELLNMRAKIGASDLMSGHDQAVILDQSNFQKKITQQLNELKDRVNNRLKDIDFQSQKSYLDGEPEEYFKDLIGCTVQCPFCGEQCDLMEHDSAIKHKTEVHRPDCLKGWRYGTSQLMKPEFCQSLVSEESSFKHNEEWHKYKNYQTVHPNWSIQPDKTAKSTLYWKWFVGKYQKEIVGTFNAKDIEVLEHWEKIYKTAVLRDLREVYHL